MDIFKGKLKASSPYTLKQAFDEVEKMAQAGEPMAQYAGYHNKILYSLLSCQILLRFEVPF